MDGWLVGWLLRKAGRLPAVCTCLSILHPLVPHKQVNRFDFEYSFFYYSSKSTTLKILILEMLNTEYIAASH